MTCIVAHRLGWMVADRRVTFGENLIGPYKVQKIRRGKPTVLVGVAGRGVVTDLMGEALGKRGDPMGEVLAVMRKHGQGCNAFVLTPHSLTELDQSGGSFEVDADYWAIGSGWQAALGWLHAIASSRKSLHVTVEDAQHAIQFASRLNSDIGDGFQVERL